MPVCSSGGVIGQIDGGFRKHLHSPGSLPMSSRGSRRDQEASRAQGMLQGQADGTLRLQYVVADAEVSTGDIIITSGIGGTFPKGLPIGTVASIDRNADAVYYTIVVRALSSAENNEEVLVITSVGEDQIWRRRTTSPLRTLRPKAARTPPMARTLEIPNPNLRIRRNRGGIWHSNSTTRVAHARPHRHDRRLRRASPRHRPAGLPVSGDGSISCSRSRSHWRFREIPVRLCT